MLRFTRNLIFALIAVVGMAGAQQTGAYRDAYSANRSELAAHTVSWTHTEPDINRAAASARIGVGFVGTPLTTVVTVKGCTNSGACTVLATSTDIGNAVLTVSGPWDSYTTSVTWTGDVGAVNLSFTGSLFVRYMSSSGGITDPGNGGGTTLPIAVAPVATPVAGTYTSVQNVALASATTGSVLHYTTDTSTPTCSSSTYTSALSVGVTQTVKAVACASGYTVSPVFTALYTINLPAPSAGMSAVSLGQNANLNGFKPFCPDADHCSAIYTDISNAAVDTPHTNAWQQFYTTNGLHPDFTGSENTLPYYILDTTSTPNIQYLPTHCEQVPNGPCPESDDTPIPLVAGMLQESGSDPLTNWSPDPQGRDHHLAVIDKATGFMYDTYQARNVNGVEVVYAHSLWDLNKPIEGQHPLGRTSADAAGLPVGLGLTVRYEEVHSGVINHALRGTIPYSSCGFYENGDCYGTFVSPASHAAANAGTIPNMAYMGMRLRLKSTVSTAGMSDDSKVIVAALKQYGMVVADNGGALFFQGTYDSRFDQSRLLADLHPIQAKDFEVVTTGSINTAELNPEDSSGGTSRVSDQTNLVNSSSRGPTTTSTRPTVSSFTSTATTVALGSPVTFSAAIANGSFGFIDNAGPVQTGGSVTVVPTQTTTYMFTALGPGGYARSTPITVNVTGTAAQPAVSSLASGTYTSDQTATLTSATQTAALHYTLDNSTATCGSPVYTSPLTIHGIVHLSTIACASGFIPSSVTTYNYTAQAPGATPTIASHVDTGTQEYKTTIVMPVTFTAGNKALVTVYSRGAAITAQSAVCGAVSGTKLMTQPTTVTTDNFAGNASMFYVNNVAGGSQNCTVTLSAESQTVVASVDEIYGSSGIDVSGGDNTSTSAHQGNFTCGNLTTTGTNRLGIAFGVQLFAGPSAYTGYTSLLATNGNAASGSISLPTAGTTTMKVSSPYTDDYTCVSAAFMP